MEEIPRIGFEKRKSSGIEVMNIKELAAKLGQTENHDPYSSHKLDFFLILIITKNSYSHFVDFKTYNLSERTALFLAKNRVHRFNKDLANSEGYGIIFTSEFVDKYYFLTERLQLDRLFNYHIETPIVSQKDKSKNSFIDIASKLHYEYGLPNDFARSGILSSLLHVLMLTAERVKEFDSHESINLHWLETFNKFRAMLEKDYVKTRNSRYYAAELLVSYKFLNTIIKKLAGTTAKSFIDDFVTVEIKRFLVSTPLSVKEISYKTGFDEPANMIKFFKKHTHKTPLQFRNQL